MVSRRRFLGAASALTGVMLCDAGRFTAAHAAAATPLLTRPIPASGERIPVIGMGTSSSFEISPRGSE